MDPCTMNDLEKNRRPIAARSTFWARRFAARLAATRITPNQVSVASVFCAALGAALLLLAPFPAGLLGAALAIQARLICNLLDGMVAIEGGKTSPLGQLYNEFPDRIADSLLIVAAGYAVALPWLGWLGALAAALTAYVRVFGGSLGLPQLFLGPMAKQHRMALLTLGCVASALEAPLHGTLHSLTLALALIAAGGLITCLTRTRAIARQLRP